MKIELLDLKAFGPFTGRVLDFSSEIPGLHVVYGPNEAGKSSALRALKSLLFGFPVRTEDCFLHSYDQLLVGGRFREEDGRALRFFRRKRKKGDLFDENDNPIDPALLGPYLQGTEQGVFDSLYGIDHGGLLRGGQEILNQKGDVGQALFAAGAGITTLRSVLDELEGEADGLFKPRGSTRTINEALSRYQELQSRLKQILLPSREWQEHRSAMEQAEKMLQDTSALRAEKDRERRRLERIRRALPQLGKRRSLMEKLDLMGSVRILPDDFGTRRRKVEEERRGGLILRERAGARIADLEKKKESVSPETGILSRAELIDEMHQRLGGHRKAMADRPRLEGMRIAGRISAAGLLKQIRPDLMLENAETLRPGLSKKKTVQALSSRYESLLQQIEQADQEYGKHEKNLEKLRRELSLLPPEIDTGNLFQAIQPARKAGDLDMEIREKRQAHERSRKQCRTFLERLGLRTGALADAANVPVPMTETVERFEEELNSLFQRKKEIQTDRLQLDEEHRQILEEVRGIEHAGQVPTEVELNRIRKTRDQGWQLLRRHWIGGEDVDEEARPLTSGGSLPETYEGLVRLSDHTADRMRREADRIQKYASLKSRMQSVEEREAGLKEEAERLETAIADAEQRWREPWAICGIAPLTPREMRTWLSGFEKAQFQLGEAEKVSAEIAAKEKYRQEVRERLIRGLGKSGRSPEFPREELRPVLIHAEELLDRIRKDQIRREKTEEKVRDLEADLNSWRLKHKAAVGKLELWQKEWEAAVAPLGLDPKGNTAEAGDFIETLQACFTSLKEADELLSRIHGIDRDTENYKADLDRLISEVAPDLKGADITQAVSALQERFTGARNSQALLDSYLEDIEAHQKEIREADVVLAGNRKQMSDLLKIADCKEEGDLDEAERRSTEYREYRKALAEVESNLFEIAEGISLPDLIDQADQVDPNGLPGRIEGLSREIDATLDPELRRLSEAIGREKNEMARMDGNSRAAQLADDLQQQLAGIRRLTERYVRVKLASRILREVIERYRAEHQDPVLKLASGHFANLTLGSFSSLRADTDDQGQPILVGVRPSGGWVKVEGMSSGTRDQLYLALRIATLESRCTSGRPMPFVIDDVLINFDDDRSLATLKVLAELGKQNQIILFTHHRRLYDMALKMKDGQPVAVHEL